MILFRGKRVDNGEWVQGYYYKSWDDVYIALSMINGKPDVVQIDPETVGQYTGLKDKNGVKIFEGDVVRDRWNNQYTPVFRNGTYMALNVEYLHLAKQEPSTQFNVVWLNGCEVVGCIHDNPELLGV